MHVLKIFSYGQGDVFKPCDQSVCFLIDTMEKDKNFINPSLFTIFLRLDSYYNDREDLNFRGGSMTEPKHQDFFEKATTGFSCQQAIRESSGKIVDLQLVSANRTFEKLTGLHASEVIGKTFSEIFSKQNGFVRTTLSDDTDVLLYRCMRNSHNKDCDQWIRVRSFNLDGNLFGATYTDVSREQKDNNKLAGLINVSTDIFVVFNSDFHILEISDAFARTFGYEKEDVEDVSFLTMINIDDVPEAMRIVKSIAEKRLIFGYRCMVHCKSGVFRSAEWRFSYIDSKIYASCREITDGEESVSVGHEDKNGAARIDERTGLYNRDFFFRSAETEINRATLYKEKISLLIIELEHLKTVNDSWGHPVSDDIIKQAALIIGHTLRKADVAVHFGGDEIVVLLPQTSSVGATAAADKLRRILAENIRTKTGKVSAAYGIAERSADEPLIVWYKRADAALNAARLRGHNCVSTADENSLLVPAEVRYTWKEVHQSGELELDAQHREIIYTGRELIDMAQANVGFNEMIKIVDRLIDQVTRHFSYEEGLLAKIKYPQYKQHVKIHQKLLGKITFMRDSFKQQQLKSPAFFVFMTKDLVLSHVEEEDAKFFELLRQAKGLGHS